MILYMDKAPGQGQITSVDKISKVLELHYDTPTSKGTRGKKIFCPLGAGADNSNGVNFEQHRKLLSL